MLGITQDNFNVGSVDVGILTFNWDDAGGQTLPDTTAIFDVCFRLTGDPEECFPVGVTGDASVTTINGRGDVKLVDLERYVFAIPLLLKKSLLHRLLVRIRMMEPSL